jgi:hypothetical protein
MNLLADTNVWYDIGSGGAIQRHSSQVEIALSQRPPVSLNLSHVLMSVHFLNEEPRLRKLFSMPMKSRKVVSLTW